MKIDLTSEKLNFARHLKLPNNNQIIFSGIFGIGKTYFLNQYFKEKAEEYELILLSPVNYSISQTDDIIEYIKYDIYDLEKENIIIKIIHWFENKLLLTAAIRACCCFCRDDSST